MAKTDMRSLAIQSFHRTASLLDIRRWAKKVTQIDSTNNCTLVKENFVGQQIFDKFVQCLEINTTLHLD